MQAIKCVWWWEMGRYLAGLAHSSSGALGPSHPGVPGEAPCLQTDVGPQEAATEELPSFSPRAQREPQEWAAHSFTLCPTHPGNCLGKRLR